MCFSIWKFQYQFWRKCQVPSMEIGILSFSFVTGPWHNDHMFIAVYCERHWQWANAATISSEFCALVFVSNQCKKQLARIAQCNFRSLFDAIVFDFRQFSNLSTDKIQMITIAMWRARLVLYYRWLSINVSIGLHLNMFYDTPYGNCGRMYVNTDVFGTWAHLCPSANSEFHCAVKWAEE